MKLSAYQLERVTAAFRALEELDSNTGITVCDGYGFSYLKIDDEMIRFTYDDQTGQYLLVPESQ